MPPARRAETHSAEKAGTSTPAARAGSSSPATATCSPTPPSSRASTWWPDRSSASPAVQAARLARGGYTGTLAEKDGYVIITATPMDPEQAQTLAADLIDRADPRIDDKWGPAGAIAVRQPTRTVTVDQLAGTATNTWPLDEQALAQITQIARQRGLISQDETVEDGRLSSHRPTNRPYTRPARAGRPLSGPSPTPKAPPT